MSIQSEPQLISLKSTFYLSLIGGRQIGLHCSLAIAAEFSVKNDPLFCDEESSKLAHSCY